ncbi:MAG: phosphatidate cytidylyltransferase [Treponema sp.]|nr:phosphatidate cytidylyltransferase [Treponema sp.]
MKGVCAEQGIIARQHTNTLLKELFRKSIHLCSAFVPFFLHLAKWPVLAILAVMVVLYSITEYIRLHGKTVPFVSAITAAAARKRDENRFVLGPVTLSFGIILCALLWQPLPAAIGIYALAFGDGLASLCGKLFGKITIPCTQGKTVAGSLSCFAAIFVSAFCTCRSALVSLAVASVGMFIEVLPLKDFDNVIIPVVIGGCATVLLGMP